jgi:N6-adenosine-specific RNA methylase IME4
MTAPARTPLSLRASIALLPSVPRALKALDELEAEIANAPSFEVLESIANKAAGLQREFQAVERVASRAGIVWVKAEVKLRLELERFERAKGTRGQIKGAKPGRSRKADGGLSGGAIVAPPDKEAAPTYAGLGIDKKRAARAKKLADISEDERKQFIEELLDDGRGITPNAILAKQRQKAKATKKHEVATATFSSDGPFGTVVIDPPWPVQKIDRDVRPNQDAFDYPTMTPDELLAFWRKEMPARLAGDVHLFVWTTQKFLPVALAFIEAIGFRYVLTMVWHKAGGYQPNDLPQYNCEFAIYARLGTPVFVDTKDFFCCFDGERREHSRKPDRFYDVIRRVTGGSRIDVFSREQRDGFAQFGNEAGKFNKGACWSTSPLLGAERLKARARDLDSPWRPPSDNHVKVSGERLAKIIWKGRQWAVTKYGIECRDGGYAIERSRVWDGEDEHGWIMHMSEKEWVDLNDFAEALRIARIMLLCRTGRRGPAQPRPPSAPERDNDGRPR